MTKLYVRETKTINTDGDTLVSVTTHRSEPDKYKYLIFIDK